MSVLKKSHILWLGFIILLLDQITKTMILHYIPTRSDWFAVTSFFDMVFVLNKGVSFGMLAGIVPPTGLLLIAATIMSGLCYMLYKSEEFWQTVSLTLMITGALGNMIDRFFYGGVIDFLYFHIGPHYWPAFNVADIAISVGVGIMALITFFSKDNKTSSIEKEKIEEKAS